MLFVASVAVGWSVNVFALTARTNISLPKEITGVGITPLSLIGTTVTFSPVINECALLVNTPVAIFKLEGISIDLFFDI